MGQSDYEYARDTIERLNRQKADHAAGYADETGKAIPALTPEEWEQLQTLGPALPSLRQAQAQKGPQFTEQIERLKKQADDLRKKETDELAETQKGGFVTAPGETQEQAITKASEPSRGITPSSWAASTRRSRR